MDHTLALSSPAGDLTLRPEREDDEAFRFRLGEAAGRLLGIGALEQLLERGLPALRPFLRQLLRFHAVII